MDNKSQVVLPGLVNRRKEEEALFRKDSDFGQPFELEPSLVDSVTWLKGYLDGENNVVVAYNGHQVVEIVTLKTPLKDDLIDLLRQYPNAKNFHIAASGSEIPDGERVEFAGRTQAPSQVENPPKLDRGLLLKGMNDVDAPGHDIREMQERLKELGYYNRELDGIFGDATDDAVRKFQRDVFGLAEADGKVGPKTWAKLWGEKPPISTMQPSPGTYLRLTKSNRKDHYGCYVLILEYIKNGRVQGSLEVCSGQPNKQNFRVGTRSISGSMEPLPEGKWYINDILWAGGKDKYGPVVHNKGLGPVTVPVKFIGPNTTARRGIEIHIDWNRPHRGNAPGTAGCVGIYNIADYKVFVSWLQDTDPRDLYVDWGLGTCPKPS
jgi:lysozyme